MNIFEMVVQTSFVAEFPITFRTLESPDVVMNDFRVTSQVFFTAEAIPTYETSKWSLFLVNCKESYINDVITFQI